MCGIAGYWAGRQRGASEVIISAMADRLSRRGPDGSGVWLDSAEGLALGHRRLAILDLSIAGHQPMMSSCGRYLLSFNGEIYNHRDLRRELQSIGAQEVWRGHSDTETLLSVLCHWGIEEGLTRLNGMFALALWDRSERTLYLARDRMGEKPLYYGQSNDTFLFGSELAALKAHPSWTGNIDRDALALYFRHNCVPSPWSIFEGIKKLPPAHYVIIRNDGDLIEAPRCYWNLSEIAATSFEKRAALVDAPMQLIDEMDALVRDAVALRMEADVPLGAFLSGGYDSTLIVAMMRAISAGSVQTFSIGFEDEAFNEAGFAKAVARHLGTEHNEWYVTSDDALRVIPLLPSIWDEPFSDSSQIPTFLVSQLARRHVTVSLSGDGGDELFGGYNRYFRAMSIWSKIDQMPLKVRRQMGGTLWKAFDRASKALPPIVSDRLKVDYVGGRVKAFSGVLAEESREAFYRSIVSHSKNPGSFVKGALEPDTLLVGSDWSSKLNFFEHMMLMDMLTYLPDDILTKVDRASMAVSLEARVPLLDHRLIEFAWRVPSSLKARGGNGKWILREVLHRYVPKVMMDRPKKGFSVPIESWLRGPLREWAEELLDENRLQREGYLDPKAVRRMWEEHLSRKGNWHYYLWDVLMFQAWLEVQ